MSDSPTFVAEDGDLRKYRTEIPNIVFDLGLSLQAGWLYAHIKRIAGDGGVCWRGTKSLAEITAMSRGAVSEAKKELRSHGLIRVIEGDHKKGEADEIRIANIWSRNFKHFDAEPEAPVHNMNTPLQTPSDNEHPPSYYETKKEPLEEGSTEGLSNESPKKPPASSPAKVKKLTPDEAQNRFDTLCESDAFGDELRCLSQMLAEENKSGEVAITRVWNEIGSRYKKNREREQLSDEAWRYGFEQAIAQGAPNIRYVTKAAKGYSSERHSPRQKKPRKINGAAATSEEAFDFDWSDLVG